MLNETMIDDVARRVQQQGATEQTIASLRDHFQGCHFSLCFDDDINVNARPYRQCGSFNLYLVDSRDHCSVLTNDEVNASGIVIAETLE
mgnify:CR=1 FL=1